MREACDLPDCPYCIECGLGQHQSFSERVSLWLDEQVVIREGLANEGPKLIDLLLSKGASLRGIGRVSGLSATYLSMVRHGGAIISPGAYLQLSEIEKQLGK